MSSPLCRCFAAALLTGQVLSLCLMCGCKIPATPGSLKQESKTAISRFHVSRLDGGPLTEYVPSSKTLSRVVSGTSLRRSYIILNDPACPIEISSFTFRPDKNLVSSGSFCTPEGKASKSWECAKFVYGLYWSFKPQASVTAWEAHNFVFDAMNRFLWTDTTGGAERGAADMNPGTEYKIDRVAWWDSAHTNNLAKWITSVVLVGSVRKKDGVIWLWDKEGLRVQMKALSMEIPPELK
jgi:hypothetical protein